ncbi:hypothetical protein HDU79_009317 [Rhizoclosmatium sp. JEL0117]|nr:hypothetical protein HDU79_009317 [Rhizoclosmatium sp. JEL0117]
MALGSSQTFGGVGIFSFSFDWSIINAYSPIITPLWATLNMFTGMIILLWIAVPLLWATNSFGSDTILGTQAEDGPNGTSVFPLGFALNAAFLFDKTGSRIKPRLFIQRNPLDERYVILNETMYQSSQPIQVTAFTVVGYFSSFMVLSSAFVHCLLWYGKDSLQRLRANYDTKDVHWDLMEKYPKIPQCWYILILSVSSIACLILCEIEPGFKLEWWGTITAVLLGSIVAVPFGVIQAISGQNISQHNVSELIWGFVRPGKITSVLTFKSITYATQSTAMNLLSSYKFGVYAKIPPRVIFKVHLVATVCGAIQATGMAMIMYMIINIRASYLTDF